jgi:hypothetical protein
MSENDSAVSHVTPAMPPRRARGDRLPLRVQVNARVRVEVEELLQRFVRDNDTTVQDCVDLALAEFLTLRGYRAAGPSEMAAAQ